MKKERLSEEEQGICFEMSKLGVGVKEIKNIEETFGISEFYNFYDLVEETIPLLEKLGFLKLNKILFTPRKHSFDKLLEGVCRLLMSKKEEEARKLIQLSGFNEFLVFLKKELTPADISLLWESFHPEGDFGYDLIECLGLEVKIEDELVTFVKTELSHLEDEDIESSNSFEFIPPRFDEEKSELVISQKRCGVRLYSKQYDLLRVIFKEPNKNWQFSEIAEIIDPSDRINWKTLHSQALAINTKIAIKTQIEKFLDTTTQSVRINPVFLEPPKKSEFDLDF